jgi:hypothetical protein
VNKWAQLDAAPADAEELLEELDLSDEVDFSDELGLSEEVVEDPDDEESDDGEDSELLLELPALEPLLEADAASRLSLR